MRIKPTSDEAVMEARSRIRRLRLEAEQRNFPEGLDLPPGMTALAIAETRDYYLQFYAGDSGE